jgi:hypothetical protein
MTNQALWRREENSIYCMSRGNARHM